MNKINVHKDELDKIVKLAKSKSIDINEITYIKKHFVQHTIHKKKSFIKTLQSSISKIIEHTPERIKPYFEHLDVILDSDINIDSYIDGNKLLCDITQNEFVKSAQKIHSTAPDLATIIHNSINNPPLKNLYWDDDRHEINGIREKRDIVYKLLKDLKFSKPALKMLEEGAKRLSEQNKIVDEEFWMAAGTIIKNQPDLFYQYCDLGAIVESKKHRNATRTYLKYAPELILNSPELFPSFKRRVTPVIHFTYDLNTFFLYAPAIMLKDKDLFKQYIEYGLKSSNISGQRYTPELEMSMRSKYKAIDYYEIGAKLINLDPKIFKLYNHQLQEITDNFTNNFKASAYLKEFTSETFEEVLPVDYTQNILKIMQNNLKLNNYRGKNLGSVNITEKKIWYSHDIVDKKMNAISKYIEANLNGTSYDYSLMSSFSEDFVDEILKIGNRNLVTKNDRILSKITSFVNDSYNHKIGENMSQVIDGLTDFFRKKGFSQRFLREIKAIKKMSATEIFANKIQVSTYETPMEDYINEAKHPYFDFEYKSSYDCLAFDGKFAGATVLTNSKSVFINVDLHSNDKVETLARAIATEAIIENKKILYIAGLSGKEICEYFPQWKKMMYEGIYKLAKKQDNLDGIFFDLNPRNRSDFSHQWGEFVALKLKLSKEKDYTYKKKYLSTSDSKTHNKKFVFEIVNPEWKTIQILRDNNLEGTFFLESVMQEPKNKEITCDIKPDLVYDKGYVIGKYLKI